jgi:hypothetical protein
MMEDACKLFAAIEKSDSKETPQETWEKSKQNGVLKSLYHNRKSVFDDLKSESNAVDVGSDRLVDLLIDNKTGNVIPLDAKIESITVIKHVPFMLNEQSYKVLKDLTKNDIEFSAAAYNYATNIYERSERKRISAPVEAEQIDDHKNWLTTMAAKTEVNPETSYQKD